MITIREVRFKGKSHCLFLHNNDVFTFEWNGFASMEDIQEAHEISLTYLDQLGIKFIIENVSGFKGVINGLHGYFNNDYIPKISEFGIQKVGVVLNESIFTQISIAEYRAVSATYFKQFNLKYEVFNSLEAVQEWINKQ